MRLLAKLLLLATALLASSAHALEDYSGPDDSVARVYTVPANAFNSGCSGGTGAFSVLSTFLTCLEAVAGGAGIEYSLTGSSGPWYDKAVEAPPVMATVLWIRYHTTPGNCGAVDVPCNLASGFSHAISCAANRSLALVVGVGNRCRSKCWSNRGNSVSAFVPITEPAQTVLAACLFLAGTGTCQIEAVDTSNYTYGSQLYRGGTWEHVGQQCQEDASSPVNDGAINTSPTGGSGTGSTTVSEGDTAATKDATNTAIASSAAGAHAAVDASKAALTSGPYPEFLDPGKSRWQLDPLGFFPAGDTCQSPEFSLPTGRGNFTNVRWDFCSWRGTDVMRSFLYWMFAVFTAIGVWSIIFTNRAGEN